MNDLKAGDVVRVKDSYRLLSAFATKVRDRDAIVQWVGPTDQWGSNTGRCCVVFQKRNGRGKEFMEIMRTSALVKVPPND